MSQVKRPLQAKRGFSSSILLAAAFGIVLLVCFAVSLALHYQPGSVLSFLLGAIVGVIIVIIGNALRPGAMRYSTSAVVFFALMAVFMLSAFVYSVQTGNTYSPISNLLYGVILGTQLAILHYTLGARKPQRRSR